MSDARRDVRRGLVLGALGLVLCASTYFVPRLPNGLYGERARGDASVEPIGLLGDTRRRVTDARELADGERLGLAVTPAGYLYLWVLCIGADRSAEILLPENSGESLGTRLPTLGGDFWVPDDRSCARVGGSGSLVALLSPVPHRAHEIRGAILNAQGGSIHEWVENLPFVARHFAFFGDPAGVTAQR